MKCLWSRSLNSNRLLLYNEIITNNNRDFEYFYFISLHLDQYAGSQSGTTKVFKPLDKFNAEGWILKQLVVK